ncbi:hypothetical protein ACIBL3_38440 [Kribbella sp. NPDC050124]|uniref:hypothetical protein n=1 Tax=Kribbella sp. NPDC050124 TaxID=3364114 RepID=UPI0037B008EA
MEEKPLPDKKNSAAEELADRYVAVWNEPDAGVRRKAVEELWTADGVHLLEPPEEVVKRAAELDIRATFEARGHAELVRRVARAYDEFVAPGQFEFRRDGAVAVVRDMVKLRWVMIPAGGGEPLGSGTDLLLVSPDGRITTDYQFVD